MKRLIYLSALIIIVAASCTEKIDFDLYEEGDADLVVDGGITSLPGTHRITLSRTASYYSNSSTPSESGAIVTITDGDTIISLVESATKPGVYETAPDFAGIPERTYTLNIVTQKGEEYTASCYMPRVAQMDSVTSVFLSMQFGPHLVELYVLQLHALEPEGVGDNYMFNIYMKDKDGNYLLDNDTLRETAFAEDGMFDGAYLPGIEIYNLMKADYDHYAIGYITDTSGNTSIGAIDSLVVRVDMLSMTEDHLDFNYALMTETDWRGSPFDGPPADVPSNISNGAYGFFWACAASSVETVIRRGEE